MDDPIPSKTENLFPEEQFKDQLTESKLIDYIQSFTDNLVKKTTTISTVGREGKAMFKQQFIEMGMSEEQSESYFSNAINVTGEDNGIYTMRIPSEFKQE